MCEDNCNCMGDVYDLQDEIKALNHKLDDLSDEVKYLKEDMRDINKGKHKVLKKIMVDYMDDVLDNRLSDFRRDIRDLTDDVCDLQEKVNKED